MHGMAWHAVCATRASASTARESNFQVARMRNLECYVCLWSYSPSICSSRRSALYFLVSRSIKELGTKERRNSKMPKSKRAQAVNLTKTAKKTRDHKSSFVQEIRDAMDQHESLYLFSYENMRSHKFKNIRMHFREESSSNAKASRIFLGKNKLMQIALGRTVEEEYSENLRKVAMLTTGSVGLLLTSRPSDEVESYFETMAEEDFARAGSAATKTVVVNNEMLYNHPVSQVEQFRKLGIPVEVQNGRLLLVGKSEHIICKEGDVLTAEACKLLLHFGIKLAIFRVKLICHWSSGALELYK